MRAPVGGAGVDAAAGRAAWGSTPSSSARAVIAVRTGLGDLGQHVHLAAVGHEVARPARVREERDGGGSAHEHQVAEAGELRGRELGEVPEPLHRRDAGSSPEACGEDLREHLRACRGGDRVDEPERRLVAHDVVAHEQRHRLTGPERLGREGDGLLDPAPTAPGISCGPTATPPSVQETSAGKDQRGDRARMRARRDDRGRGVERRASACAPSGGPTPRSSRRASRCRLSQRRVERLVVRGVVADDVHHRRVSPAGVVQVGDPVAEPGAEVEQGRRRAVPSSARTRPRRR